MAQGSGATSAAWLAFRPMAKDRDALLPGGVLSSDMLAFAKTAASCSDPVLLYGETGSGKSWLARMIHSFSPLAAGPYCKVNCAALAPTLFESEVFGHVRGAFTGADRARKGLFEDANGGTLLLDEIGELPPELQAKLLGVVEDGHVCRVGSHERIPVRVRLISATNRDLGRMMQAGAFRRDLFYRLAVLVYTVPPLRERREEIPEIVRFLLKTTTADGGDEVALAPAALDLLSAHTWPGNVRELQNVLARAAVSANGRRIIQLRHIREALRQTQAISWSAAPPPVSHRRYQRPLDEDEERHMIYDALAAERGNRTRAADRLGMSRSTLWAKLRRWEAGDRRSGHVGEGVEVVGRSGTPHRLNTD